MSEAYYDPQPDEMMAIIDKAFRGENYDSEKFSKAAMALFREYRNTYAAEWQRMDNCDRLFLGDTWPLIKSSAEVNGSTEAGCCDADSKKPEPSTPIILSTIENIESDLDPELPECFVKPQDGLTELQARAINFALQRQFEDCGFPGQYYKATHELILYGWDALEIGFEPDDYASVEPASPHGSLFIRHVPSRSILFDPTTANVQDGRAIFKFDKHPRHWFRMRFPEEFPKMESDVDDMNEHDLGADAPQSNTNQPPNSMLLVEMWYRSYDAEAGRYRIHMAQFAGGVEVANSAKQMPEGMYDHGKYPFELEVLYPRVGTPFGYGIADICAGLQMYSDKLNQIILMNALRASRSRLVIDSTNEEAYDDIIDFSKEVIQVPNMAGINWFQDKPLPQYIIQYQQLLQNSIKEESGANDQSRGVSGGGVTAATAIKQLQEMATKRSAKIAERRREMFRRMGAMCIDILADCGLTPIETAITVDGALVPMVIDQKLFKNLCKGRRMLSSHVYVRTSRQSRYSKMSQNELALQFMQMATSSGQNVDFTPFIELMDFEDKELVLDKIRASRRTEMAQMAQQLQQMAQENQLLTQQLQQYKQSMSRAQAAMMTRNQQMSEDRAAAPLQIPEGLAQNAV